MYECFVVPLVRPSLIVSWAVQQAECKTLMRQVDGVDAEFVAEEAIFEAALWGILSRQSVHERLQEENLAVISHDDVPGKGQVRTELKID
jgi:hypothetical protein